MGEKLVFELLRAVVLTLLTVTLAGDQFQLFLKVFQFLFPVELAQVVDYLVAL